MKLQIKLLIFLAATATLLALALAWVAYAQLRTAAALAEAESIIASHYLVLLIAAAMLLVALIMTYLLLRMLRSQRIDPATKPAAQDRFPEPAECQHRDEIGNPTGALRRASSDLQRSNTPVHPAAQQDDLTRLSNRRLFTDSLSRLVNHAKQRNERFAVLVLDVNDCKRSNATLTGDASETLLREVAARLRDCLRAADYLARAIEDNKSNTVARLDNNEFMVVLSNITHSAEPAKAAQRIITALRQPIIIQQQAFQVKVNIGITLFPEDGNSADALISNATTALRAAKQYAKSSYHYYSDAMRATLQERFKLEDALRQAFDRDEFVLYYQPQINVKTAQPASVEALVRWRHPQRGIIAPSEFLPLAESMGLIEPLDAWVLFRACQQAAEWHKSGFAPVKMTVNLSNRHFKTPNLSGLIKVALLQSGLAPDKLELELTEVGIIEAGPTALATLQALKAAGISIAIDGFSASYASLAAVRSLPIDTLKIDGNFAHALEHVSEEAAIIAAILAMGRRLKLRIAAKNVERQRQLSLLHAAGYDFVQGHLINRPLPADEMTTLLSTWHHQQWPVVWRL